MHLQVSRYSQNPKELIAWIVARIDRHDHQIGNLQINARDTFPIYRHADIPDDLNDGEYWIGSEDGDLYWFVTIDGVKTIMSANGTPQ